MPPSSWTPDVKDRWGDCIGVPALRCFRLAHWSGGAFWVGGRARKSKDGGGKAVKRLYVPSCCTRWTNSFAVRQFSLQVVRSVGTSCLTTATICHSYEITGGHSNTLKHTWTIQWASNGLSCILITSRDLQTGHPNRMVQAGLRGIEHPSVW